MFLPAEGKQNVAFSPNFTQTGKRIAVNVRQPQCDISALTAATDKGPRLRDRPPLQIRPPLRFHHLSLDRQIYRSIDGLRFASGTDGRQRGRGAAAEDGPAHQISVAVAVAASGAKRKTNPMPLTRKGTD